MNDNTWTAEVTVGKATSDITGAGALSVAGLIGEALGVASLDLTSVLVGEDGPVTWLQVGFRLSDSKSILFASIRIMRA